LWYKGLSCKEYASVRESERDNNKEYNHQISVYLQWDCRVRIQPLLHMVFEAIIADLAWLREHGDTRSPARREQMITQPLLKYLGLDAVPSGGAESSASDKLRLL
jgi:hypothetical protein